MQHARLLLDLFAIVAAMATPLFYHAPSATKSAELAEFISPSSRNRRAVSRVKAKKESLLASSATYTVTATVYEAVPGQTDNQPYITADNSHIKPHYGSKKRWLALSRDLLKPWGGKFNYGDKVRVRGISPELDGLYTVHDTMNRRHRHCLDVLVHPREHMNGLWKNVKIHKVVAHTN
jgi:hypothetical protein